MLKITWKYITSNKKNTMLTIMGVAFSVMLMFSLMQMGDCVAGQFTKMATAGMKRDLTVYNLTYEQIQEVERLFEREHAEGYMSLIYGGIIFQNGLKGTDLFGLSGDAEYFKDTGIVEGDYPENEYDICLEEGYNLSLPTPYQVGETIILTVCDAESRKELIKEFKVSGILKNFIADDYHLWTTLGTAEAIRKEFGDTDFNSNSVAVVMDKSEYDAEGVGRICLELTNQIDDFWRKHLIMNDEKEMVYRDEGSFTSVSKTMKSLTVILGICMILFIYNTYNIGTIRKIRQLGTMRCLGVSKEAQNKLILYESLIVGHIGIAIGILLGNGLNYLAAGKIINGLMMTNYHISIRQTPISYAETYLLALVSILLGTWRIVHNCKKLTISQMLQFTEQSKRRSTEKREGRPQKGGGMLWNIAERNLRRNVSKSVSLMITMLISIALCLIIFNAFTYCLHVFMEKELGNIFQYRVSCSLIDGDYISLDSVKKVEDLSGSENVCKNYLSLEWEGKLGNQETPIRILWHDDMLFGLMLEGLGIGEVNYKEEPYSVLYSTDGSRAEKIEFIHSESGKSMEVPIFSTVAEGEIFAQGYYSNVEQILIINDKMAEQLNYESKGFSTIWVKKISKAEISEGQLSQCFLQESIYLENLNRGEEGALKQLLGMVALAAYIMAATIFLTGIIMSNTIQANMISRRKEFGIMRAIGMTNGKSILIGCIENGILFVTAYLFGAVLAVFALLFLGQALDDGLPLSPVVFIGTAVLFLSMIELISMKHMKKGLRGSISEKLWEE